MSQEDKVKQIQADLEKTQYMPKQPSTKPADGANADSVNTDRVNTDDEATQYMGVVEAPKQEETATSSAKMSERPYQPGTKKPDLSDTQTVPRVGDFDDDRPIQPPIPQNNGLGDGVRELPPDRELQQQAGQQANWWQAHKKKVCLLAGGFLVAIFIGFMLAGYAQDKSEEASNQRYQEQQAMQNKQDDLNRQEADLKQQQKELEQKKQELQERERSLESQSDRAKGRNEALNDENQQGTLGKLFDKVTGKADEREQSIQQNKQTSAQADTDVEDVRQSIDDAQQMLDNVNQKLDSVAQMKQEADNLADKAKTTYDENQGTIDTALSYAKAGANLLIDWILN